MEGTIFDVQRFCINDGPGIRTTVFLKGCPLNCLWCHNPESKSFKPQLSFNKNKCILCGKCETVCPAYVHHVSEKGHIVNFDSCKLCGACQEACPTGAISIIGKKMNHEEIIKLALKDKKYYENSGGGLTISGGEPMSQFNFTLSLAKSARRYDMNVAVETSGYGKYEDFETLSDFVNLFLFDYKATGDESYKKFTGVDRKLIQKNFDLLSSKNSAVFLRCPIIPGYNLNEMHLKAISQLGVSYKNIKKIQLLPYHNFGIGKGKQIGIDCKLNTTHIPSDSEVEEWINKIKSWGFQDVERG